jgi:hypothetical protein
MDSSLASRTHGEESTRNAYVSHTTQIIFSWRPPAEWMCIAVSFDEPPCMLRINTRASCTIRSAGIWSCISHAKTDSRSSGLCHSSALSSGIFVHSPESKLVQCTGNVYTAEFTYLAPIRASSAVSNGYRSYTLTSI